MRYVLKNCRLFDGRSDGAVREHMDIYIAGDRIVKVVPSGALEAGYQVRDLRGRWVLPGLINLHAHLFGSGRPSKVLGGGGGQQKIIRFCGTRPGGQILLKVMEGNMRSALFSGCTTVRGVGDFYYADVKLRDRINSGQADGPRLLVSGPAITVPGGHGDGTFAVTGSTEAELAALASSNAARGVDLIKICLTGGVMDAKIKGEPGEVKMSFQQVKAVCDRAHQMGFSVASHTESSAGVKIALAAGVDTVEHGSILDEEDLKLAAERKTALICTLSPALPLARLSPELTKLSELCVYNSQVVLDNMTAGVKAALAAGVAVGLGTDASCPYATQYNMWREAAYFAKYAGVSNAFALHTATLKNAEILGLEQETGSVEAGKCADLIVTDEDPLEDLSALRELELVVARGRLYDHPKVKKDPDIERELDRLLTE